jgi:hypothetical protein
MLKIMDYKLRESLEGRTFHALTLQGGIEIIKSTCGGINVTIRKCSLPTTFDEPTCMSLIEQELPGKVERVECEPYEYTISQTGEVVLLNHRYECVGEELPAGQEVIRMHTDPVNLMKAQRA